MAGHSKWATIKRKKGALDAKRGKLFSKLSKNISIAARNGSDPDMNPALRTAIDTAKSANMPKDNIDRAVAKGAGELEGVTYEEITYEAYGPSGIAIIIECVTDNTNRTVSDVRSILKKVGGSLGSSGSVLYMFEQKGVVNIEAGSLKDSDDLELALIDAGADDIQQEDEGWTVLSDRTKLNDVVDVFAAHDITPASSGIEWITANMVDVDADTEEKLQNLIEQLEDSDDVNNVYTNANI